MFTRVPYFQIFIFISLVAIQSSFLIIYLDDIEALLLENKVVLIYIDPLNSIV